MANPNLSPADAAVQEHLDDAASTMPLAPESEVYGEAHSPAGETHAAEPTIGGFADATVIVAVAALVTILGMLWKKVPAAIAGALDKRIAEIRAQLDEAKKLRSEAEALKTEYAAKAAAAESDAAAMRENAHAEAAAIVAKAKEDADALMARRARMAEDKIAAAERAAIAEVRAKAADAAAGAAAAIIAEKHGADADRALIDRTIAGLGRLN
ncbi:MULTISPECIES: F0F1 ATP synthase subunit B family protein [unclassified Sphingosinithalassobacter]|uniref:F0F1 ATP synthase subunit B family protein n=1 Tax=unclassified Sphingosinithalassobacter TaxID=2676235 RepID=UPI00165DFD60|nr:hypothetical protein [Sphingosinithalassobacter sp. CS137]